ncbi:MAG TPA: hypothetical protein PKD26_16355 [Pyrinomonadaceae bacterium]|nr:hypothetical protein [Pyrinomonadaceae bacterium]
MLQNVNLSLKKPLLFAGGFCLLVYLLIPLIILFLMNVLLSAASVLDPLHAKKHLADLWRGFAIIFGFQLAFSGIVWIGTVLIVKQIAERFVGLTATLLAAVAGMAIHFFTLAVIGLPLYLLTLDELFSSFAILFGFFLVLAAPTLGLICSMVFLREKSRSHIRSAKRKRH